MPSCKRRKQVVVFGGVLLTPPCHKTTKVKRRKAVKVTYVKKKTEVPKSSGRRKKVKLPEPWTWDGVRDYFMRIFSTKEVNVIANEVAREGLSYEDACKKHGKNMGTYKVYFNFLYDQKGLLLWLGSGQRIYQRLKSAVGRINTLLENKAK